VQTDTKTSPAASSSAELDAWNGKTESRVHGPLDVAGHVTGYQSRCVVRGGAAPRIFSARAPETAKCIETCASHPPEAEGFRGDRIGAVMKSSRGPVARQECGGRGA
jgi:hypothetical protein